MLFSLDDSLERIFGCTITFKERLKIARDIKKIKRMYRREKGFFKAFRLKPRKVLFAFEIYLGFDHFSRTQTELWEEFNYYCQSEGAFFLDNLI